MIGARLRSRGRGPRVASAALVVVTPVALVAALAGCASVNGPGAPTDGMYSCLGTPIPAEAVTDPHPASELDAELRPALDGLEVPAIDPAEWTIVSAGSEQVVLLRELAEPADRGGGDLRTHERMTIEIVDAPNIPGSPTWMLTSLGDCALAVALPGAGSATVGLDPDRPADPASTEIPLLVTEMACNSGEDATGRIDVVALRETDTTVEVVIAVDPRGGDATCPSNPPTPYTLTLDEPLGDRELLDASVMPPRPIT